MSTLIAQAQVDGLVDVLKALLPKLTLITKVELTYTYNIAENYFDVVCLPELLQMTDEDGELVEVVYESDVETPTGYASPGLFYISVFVYDFFDDTFKVVTGTESATPTRPALTENMVEIGAATISDNGTIIEIPEEQVIYLGKDGSDGNTGRKTNEKVLTAAKALELWGADKGLPIVCFDAGEYDISEIISNASDYNYNNRNFTLGTATALSANAPVGLTQSVDFGTGTNSNIYSPTFEFNNFTGSNALSFHLKLYSETQDPGTLPILFSHGASNNVLGNILVYRRSNNFNLEVESTLISGVSASVTFTNFFQSFENVWISLDISINYATGEIKAYRDGVLFSTQNYSTALIFPAQNVRLRYGNYYVPNPTDYHKGLMTDIKIFNKILSAGEVTQLHNNTYPDFADVLDLDIENATGTTILDLSRYSSTGAKPLIIHAPNATFLGSLQVTGDLPLYLNINKLEVDLIKNDGSLYLENTNYLQSLEISNDATLFANTVEIETLTVNDTSKIYASLIKNTTLNDNSADSQLYFHVWINDTKYPEIVSVTETSQVEIENPASTESDKYVSVRRFWQGITKHFSEFVTFAKGLVLTPVMQTAADPNNSIINGKLGEALFYKSNTGVVKELAFADGIIEYYNIKWFTPTGNVSVVGSTVTSVGTQFTAAMVGSKIKINGEVRYITAFIDNKNVTINEATSTNYTNITPANWGVYSIARIEDTNGYMVIYNNQKAAPIIIAGGSISVQEYFSHAFGGARMGSLGFELSNTGALLFSSTTSAGGTKDLGLKRLLANWLQVTNGSTGKGNLSVNILDTSINQYQYNAALPTADTLGDTRYIVDSNNIDVELCTTAGASKGIGQWLTRLLKIIKSTGEFIISSLSVGTSVNYVKLQDTGVRLNGTATTWEDDNLDPTTLTGGGNLPTKIQFASTTTNVASFSGSQVDEVEGCREIPHRAKLNIGAGTDVVMYFHGHTYATTNDLGNAYFGLEYFFTKEGVAVTTSTIINVLVPTLGVAWAKKSFEFPAIVMPNELGSQFHFRFFRLGNDGLDTYNQPLAISTIGYHYEIDSLGSEEKLSKL